MSGVTVSREALGGLLSCFQEGGDYGAHFALPDGVDSLELAGWYNALYAALTPPAPASAQVRTQADVERDLTRWLLEGDRGMSSEAIARATLRLPAYTKLPPADSDDFGRCLRLINRIPEARMGVTLLGVVNKGWAYLDGIWEDLTRLGIDAGMLECRCGHPEIDRLIRARPRG